jgi:hypothetical protein
VTASLTFGIGIFAKVPRGVIGDKIFPAPCSFLVTDSGSPRLAMQEQYRLVE